MSSNTTNIKNIFNKRRPIGVWILTIHAFIFAGIYPLRGEAFHVFKGETAFFSDDQVLMIILWASLSISIMIASILAWKGWEIGRLLFLILTTLFFASEGKAIFSWIFQSFSDQIPVIEQINAWLQAIRDVFFLILHIWYFNRPLTREFYKKADKPVTNQETHLSMK